MKHNQSNYLPGIFDVTPNMKNNCLYYGDNLTIMKSMPDASIDLIYLDPPFNSQRNYNLIYKRLTGLPVPEQEVAFCDAWEMDAEKQEMAKNIGREFRNYGADDDLVVFWETWIKALQNTQPRLLAYLIYMSYRLFEMRRILKSPGSIYLHCDPTASHYIKVIMDGIFGHANFRNEIIWKRTSAHNSGKMFGPVHDVILSYTKGANYTWNTQRRPYDESYIESHYSNVENGRRYKRQDITGAGIRHGETGQPWRGIDPTAKGRHWMRVPAELEKLDEQGLIYWPDKNGAWPYLKLFLDERPGMAIQDIWDDINPINPVAKERLGYPTQKPLALLERIIQTSSNPGDIIFDPFAGCGTAVYAAHLLGRKWIGCDIAILSVQIVRDVLLKRYGLNEGEHYQVNGIPLSVEGAEELCSRDPHQFQHWSVELAGGFSSTKHSGDLGIDGRIHFETQDGLRNMVVSVKGGKQLTPAFVRELRGVLEREDNSEMGGLICLHPPTKGMISEAAAAGLYTYQGTDYPRLQIRTVQELLDGKGFYTPSKVQTLNWIKQLHLPL